MLSQRKQFQIACILVVLSGAASLSHQLLWTNRMTDLLGASAASVARVFGCFFLGLSVGAGLMGWKISSVKHPWRWLACAEFAVALMCLPILWLSYWTDWIWPWLGLDGLLGWQGAWIKWILSMGVVFFPAMAMGTTLPIVIKGVRSASALKGHFSVWLYALNTLGGLLGLGITGCLTLYAFGISGAMMLAIGTNICVGMIALWVDRKSKIIDHHIRRDLVPDGGVVATLGQIGWKASITAFASGFLILALEILAMDLVMLIAPLSFHAPLAVLGAFIFTLALSASCIPLLGTKWRRSSQWIMLLLAAAGILAAAGPYWFVQSAMNTEGVLPADSLVGFTRSLVFTVLLSFGPCILLGGFIFPSLLGMIPDKCEKSNAVGFLLAFNGLGGLLGAEFTYGLLMPMLGVYLGIGGVAVIYVLMAFLWVQWNSKRKPVFANLAVFGALLITAASFFWLRQLPVVNPNMGLKILELDSGREGNLAVVEHENFGRGLLFSNQYLLGSTNVRYDQERQAHIPLMLHGEPKHVCFVGLATGITPSAALQHSMVEKIDVVELSSMVTRAAGTHFTDFNAHIIQDPRAHIYVEDGRTFIASQRDQYDVIVSDLFLPWRPGVGRLYSAEHFQSTRNALRSGGLYCHWLPLYQFTKEQLDLVLRTFQSVYPKVYLFEGKLQLDAPVLGLVGFKSGDLKWEELQDACRRERLAGNIKDPTVRWLQGLAMLFRGTIDSDVQYENINTLDNMQLELQAGLDRMIDPEGSKYLTGISWLSLAQNYLQKNARRGYPNTIQDYPLKGMKISVLTERIKQGGETKNSSLREIFSQMPEAMLKDQYSDWKRWAGAEISVRWKPKSDKLNAPQL